ncbi:MAG: MEDS domain-containing protein [Acidobacteriia bacterium]|nr:MEDS domain-containing protein [Terriglobia bacterium]
MVSRPIASVEQFHPPVSQLAGHAVQFYETDAGLVEMLGQHIGSALKSGDTSLVIATKAHRQRLAEELQLRKVNMAAAINAGQYLELDAAETLAKFMVGGGPDQQKFADTIETVISRAGARTKAGKRLVVFGEMVALLWGEGKRDATVRLEELWNDLAQRHTFHLTCGYPIPAFDRLEHRQLFFSICGEHTHINPEESHAAKGSDQRRRSVARLQQKAKALETEIRLGRERILLLQKAAKSGTWELDIVNDIFSFSSAAARLLGFGCSSRVRLGQLMDLMYYSGDREAVFSQLQAAQRHRKDFATTFRVRQGEETRIISIQGKTFYNSGTPIMLGVLADVTPALEASAVPAPKMAAHSQRAH